MENLFIALAIKPTKEKFEHTNDRWLEVWGLYRDEKKEKLRRKKLGVFDMVDLQIYNTHQHVDCWGHVWVTATKKFFYVRVPDRRLYVTWKGTSITIKIYPEEYNIKQPDNKVLIEEFKKELYDRRKV